MPHNQPTPGSPDEPEADDVSFAPESGQPPGGREDPWEGEEASADHLWPSEHHPPPKDEL
jgi:hypothetical protein